MAAGDADERPAHLHVRTGNLAGIDGVAQVHIHKPRSAHVAHGREPGHQRGSRVHHAVDGLFRIGLRELVVGIEVGLHRQVRVHIDEAGQHRQPAQVDHLIARLRRRCAGRRDGCDAVAADDDGLRVEGLAGVHIEQMAGADEGSCRRRGGLRRNMPARRRTKQRNRREQSNTSAPCERAEFQMHRKPPHRKPPHRKPPGSRFLSRQSVARWLL